MFNFLLYYTSKIQHLTSNLKLNIKHCLWIYLYIQIFSNTKIRSYHIIFLYKYIWIFIRIIFLIRIYSDMRLYRFWDINIFKYSFVSKIYIRQNLIWKCDWSTNSLGMVVEMLSHLKIACLQSIQCILYILKIENGALFPRF